METFGRYILSERVAAGGMAEIWRGALLGAAGFSRPLAIKRIRPDHEADADFLRMFVDEARIASTLRHPNIVSVTDFGEVGGQYFLAMEYVAGRHLGIVIGASIKQSRPLPLGFAVSVVRDALLGLAHAHEKTGVGGTAMGIVHRDISPQNILVGFDGVARVADFGIAKALGRITQTDSGAIKGKYSYMSPEQARGDDVDARSDIYAMGVVLWEALAGQRLYGPELDQSQVLARVMRGQARALSECGRDLPAPLVEIVRTAMSPSVDTRFQNAQAFARALSTQLATIAPGWSAPDGAEVMRALFPSEIAEEQHHLAQLESMARKASKVEMPAVTTSFVPVNASAMAMPDTLVPTVVVEKTVAAPARKRSMMPLIGTALVVIAVGAGVVMTRPEPVVQPVKPVEPVKMTSVVVESVPAGASILVDGAPRGQTPLRLSVPTGSRAELSAHLDGRADAHRTLEAIGETMVVLMELEAR